jgi:hypothetical protein
MIRHLLQIFFTLGLTFIPVSFLGRAPARLFRASGSALVAAARHGDRGGCSLGLPYLYR